MASKKITAFHLELTAEERKTFEQALPQAKSDVHILVTGRTGTGKSKLVNALTGAIVTDEARSLESETRLVEKYEALVEQGYTINVWDSPGLFDGSGRECEYVQSMKEKCGDKIDMLLYCVDMSTSRADVDDMSSGMRLLTEALGQEVWNHAMIVLTFANIVAERIHESSEERRVEEFQAKVTEWNLKVWSALERAGVQREIVPQVLVEPAGDYLTPHLPDRIHWLGHLWLQFLFRIKEEAKPAILMTNKHRVQNSEYLQPTECDALQQLPLIIHMESCRNTIWWKTYNTISKVKTFAESRGNGEKMMSKLCATLIKKMLQKKKSRKKVIVTVCAALLWTIHDIVHVLLYPCIHL